MEELIIKELVAIKRLLLENKAVFNVNEFSEYSGLSKSYIYKLCSDRKITFFSPTGKLNFFSKEAIHSFLLSNEISSIEEIEKRSSNYLIHNSKNGGLGR